MRVSISVGSAYYDGENWEDLVEYVVAADRFGVDTAWSAEAWDTPSPGTLRSLAGQLGKTELASEIRLLDRVLYAALDQQWTGQRLWGLCRGGIKPAPVRGSKVEKEVLPALFKISG